MALDKAALKTDLEAWMGNPYDDVNDAADAFANAYDSYALDAVDVSGDSPLLTNKPALVSAISTLTTAETPSTAAKKFETGIIAYWAGATFELLYPPTGTIAPEISASVTINILPNVISIPLTIIFTDTVGTSAVKAQLLSDLFDIATKTITVTCVGTIILPPFTLAVAGIIN